MRATWQPGRDPRQPIPETHVPRRKSPRQPSRLPRFVYHCLRDSAIRRVLANGLANLWKRTRRSFAVTRLRASVSLPDPAWNGILAGVLSQTPLYGAIGVNFIGENDVLC